VLRKTEKFLCNGLVRYLTVGIACTSLAGNLLLAGCSGTTASVSSPPPASTTTAPSSSVPAVSSPVAPPSSATVKPVDNYVVQVGYYNCDHMTAAPIAKDAGIYEALGIKVNVTGNGKVPDAMTAGQMDVGYVGTGTIELGILKGAPIFAPADNFLGGSWYLVVSNDIKDAKDLVGKRVALGVEPEKRSSTWCRLADQLGIPRNESAYQNVAISGDSNKYLAMVAGQLDGFTCCDPWGSMAEYNKTGHIVGTFTTLPDGWGDC
jgi:NitT/TauT family transport system substrate-binding protein